MRQLPRRSKQIFLGLRKALRDEAREQLRAHLHEMDPFRFEELIRLLLEEMGYDGVNTTSATNDKGVDVIGEIELGISSVREVIQVKRTKGSVHRPILRSAERVAAPFWRCQRNNHHNRSLFTRR